MRQFYEEWCPYVNRQPTAGDMNWIEFISIGFSHHMEIIAKVKFIDERIFYIHECALRAWDKYTLRDYIKSGLYQNRESLPNNFDTALTDLQFVINATKALPDVEDLRKILVDEEI